MATVKQERATGGRDEQSSPSDNEAQEPSVENATTSGGKRRSQSVANESRVATSRRSKRQRVAPKQYVEQDYGRDRPTKSGRHVQWKEEELEKLLDCLKKYQRADNVHSVKKHVKTKNLQQVEAKLESLRNKALDLALDETVSMPPLQCWETLANDVTSTLGDESYKEISKVFWTATSESSARRKGAKSDPSQPNYNEIYKFLAALLRGTQPSELSPIDAMVVLECLNNTVEFLQNLETEDQSAFLQKRYKEQFLKLYSSGSNKSQRTKGSTTPASSSTSKQLHTDNGCSSIGEPSTSGSSEAVQDKEPIGLGTLNPFNIPVDKLNLIKPRPCSEHGNMYCWIPACRERHKTQQALS